MVLGGLLVGSATSCDDNEGCHEPDPRGSGVVGDTCVTTRDCVAGLSCIGTSLLEDAQCTPATELPGHADPGCLAHAGDWEYHEALGARPIASDEEGCDLLIFEGCVPDDQLYHMETWRQCNGCCWRLVSLWEDHEICGSNP